MRTNSRAVRHRVAHQAAHAAVSIGKGMNVVEAMMGSTDRHDTARLTELFEPIAVLEIRHETGDALAGWWNVVTDGVFVRLKTGPPL